MKKILLLVPVLIVSGALGIPLILSAPAVRKVPAETGILVSSHADAQVSSIIERSCQNCHSWKTEWPLYSRVYPFSSMIEHDVLSARTRLNFSLWQTYRDSEKRLLLVEIGAAARNHVMPPRRYTLIHPEAKLSDAEANRIYQWAHTERESLSPSPEE